MFLGFFTLIMIIMITTMTQGRHLRVHLQLQFSAQASARVGLLWSGSSHISSKSVLFLNCLKTDLRPCRIVDMTTSKAGGTKDLTMGTDYHGLKSRNTIWKLENNLMSRKAWSRQGSSCCPWHLHWQEGFTRTICCFPFSPIGFFSLKSRWNWSLPPGQTFLCRWWGRTTCSWWVTLVLGCFPERTGDFLFVL